MKIYLSHHDKVPMISTLKLMMSHDIDYLIITISLSYYVVLVGLSIFKKY